MKMKRYAALLLALLLLLSGCAGEKEQEITPQEAEAILQQRRDTAEAHMRYMMSVLWQTDEQIVYSKKASSMGPEMDGEEDTVILQPDRIYSGMPYTHGGGGAESFLSYGTMDDNGVFQMTDMTADLLSGGGGTKPGNTARLSNDCADAVSWAWAKVGNSHTFTMTQNMTEERGCLPVGDYKTQADTYKKTKVIAEENGEAVMFEAYACLQKADAVVTFNSAGHAMMIASVHVERKDGTIDPEASYVLVHEQFSKNYTGEVTRMDETIGKLVYCLGGVDREYTFSQLYKKGYLPVTIRELIDPAPVAVAELVDSVENPTLETITEGTISSMSKICIVTLTITDDRGNVVQQASCFPTEGERQMFRMVRFTEITEQSVMRGSLDPSALKPGTYRCLVECVVGTGETLTARDFTFEI